MYDPGETLLENDQPDVPSKWLDFQVFMDKDYKREVPSLHPKKKLLKFPVLWSGITHCVLGAPLNSAG